MSEQSNDANPFAEDNFDARPSDIDPFSVEIIQGNIPTLNTDMKDVTPRKKRVAVIRTTDRLIFKRCRRRWGWTSHLRANLGSKTAVSPLWLGSGFHFAMEDFHGPNIYGNPVRALDAYAIATHRKGGNIALPPSFDDDMALGRAMLGYYANNWLSTRDPLETFYYNGLPQLEANFRILIPFDATAWGYDEVVYSGTLDRVVIDENDVLWIVEYKTAKNIVTSHFQTDPQVTAYCWACRLMYPGYEVGGVIYQQHLKRIPDKPKILLSGKLSTDVRQSTDYSMYRRALIDMYGSTQKAPASNMEALNTFCKAEHVEYNKFVHRARLFRNQHQCDAEGVKILMEVADMLNPELDLYPNPDRTCNFCSFQGPCVAMDDGSDYEQEIEAFNQPREKFYDSWRFKLPSPEELDKVKENYNFFEELPKQIG